MREEKYYLLQGTTTDGRVMFRHPTNKGWFSENTPAVQFTDWNEISQLWLHLMEHDDEIPGFIVKMELVIMNVLLRDNDEVENVTPRPLQEARQHEHYHK